MLIRFQLTVNPLKTEFRKRESTFLSNGSGFLKENYSSEGFQASPVCSSGNNNIYMKMTTGHW
jgi:hypothetical protein